MPKQLFMLIDVNKNFCHLFLCLTLCAQLPAQSQAATIPVTTKDQLQAVINAAQSGDTIELAKGEYFGNFIINKPLSLHCKTGAVINGQHKQNSFRIIAPNVHIRDCTIVNWGNDLTEMDAGVFVEKTASGIHIENNYLHGDAFGLWLDSTVNAQVNNNKIEGNLKIRSQDRGNGIHLFNVKNARVENNEIWHTRDGIYIDTSTDNQLNNNVIHDLRYGIHYMYSYSNLLHGNHTYNTRTGYALMQSKKLTVINNISENDSNYGLLMNFITDSSIKNNQIINTRQPLGVAGMRQNYGAQGKAFFLYNSHFNELYNNLISHSDIGIHLTAGSEANKIYGNYFLRNRRQVKYVGNTKIEWSYQNQGNYWSDYQGWDRNADGIGDLVFEPNDAIDKVLWKYPVANLLTNSPALQVLRWVQKEFPVLKSPGITDSYPKMKNDFLVQ